VVDIGLIGMETDKCQLGMKVQDRRVEKLARTEKSPFPAKDYE
jgi:hypothetical protein